LVVEAAVLYTHSPLEYAPNYGQPATYTDLFGQTLYGAWPRTDGGWSVLAADSRSRLGYFQIDRRGAFREQVLGPGDYSSQPSLGKRGRKLLGAWVGDSGQDVWAAYLGGSHPHPFRLIPPGGTADLPFVRPVRFGFEVLFSWQPPAKSAHDIYLASVRAGSTHAHLVDLVKSGDVALAPKAAVDGRRALDVVYLQRTSHTFGEWQVRFQRFTLRGRSLGKPESLGSVTYAAPNALTGSCSNVDVQPRQWAVDVKRASDGSVWAAWATGDDCVVKFGVSGVNTLSVAHWSASGKQLLPASPIDPNVDASGQAVALALQGKGGVLYYMQPGSVVSYLLANRFTGNGTPTSSERVSYEGGGNAANPLAARVGRYPSVLWLKVRAGDALLEGTSYHPHQPPDLLTHLGLNIGNLWQNVALELFGPLAGGIALRVVNIFLLLPLLPVWLVVRRFPPRLRWPLYLAAMAALLAWVFVRSFLPGSVLVMTSLGMPDAWYAVAGAAVVSGWSGRYLLARQESGMRATAMAVIALAFVAAMDTVMFIQGQITRI
jgi:hypothetical protein